MVGTRIATIADRGVSTARRCRVSLQLRVADHESRVARIARRSVSDSAAARSEEHTSELKSIMRISYAVFCLKEKTIITGRKQTREKHSIYLKNPLIE